MGKIFTNEKVNCSHWVILGFSMIFLEDTYSAIMICILSVILYILSDIVSSLLDKKGIRI